MKKNIISNSFIIIITFIIAYYGRTLVSHFIKIPFNSPFLKYTYFYSWWIIPSLSILISLYGYKDLLRLLGLNKGFLISLIFSIITVLPMFISSAIIGDFNKDINLGSLLHKTIIAGLTEEYFFRAFLFGILFSKLKWGFIPASILGAVAFGIGHIYQGTTFSETIGIFLVTASGAMWFAWLFIEWNNNLWVPIFLHTFMNLSWILFDVSANALGGIYTNIFRIITITLTITITILYNKKKKLKINKHNLIINNSFES